MSGCSHGKTFKEPCIECQLVLAREGLAWAQQSVAKYSKFIAEFEPERQPDQGPWVEYGTGWAKVHFLRDVTEQDRANLAAALSLRWPDVPQAVRAGSQPITDAVQHAFRAADDIDWKHLDQFIPQSGHGRFWRAIFAEVRAALSRPEQK